MRLMSLITSLLITFSMPAMAQDAPDAEVFGGYSFLKSEGGGGLHGWNASVAGNLSPFRMTGSSFRRPKRSSHEGPRLLQI